MKVCFCKPPHPNYPTPSQINCYRSEGWDSRGGVAYKSKLSFWRNLETFFKQCRSADSAGFLQSLDFGKSPWGPQKPTAYTHGPVNPPTPEGANTRVELLLPQIIVENIVY